MVTGEFVVVGFLKPSAPLFVFDKKSPNSVIMDASGFLHNVGRRAVPWRRQSPRRGVYRDVNLSHRHTGYLHGSNNNSGPGPWQVAQMSFILLLLHLHLYQTLDLLCTPP